MALYYKIINRSFILIILAFTLNSCAVKKAIESGKAKSEFSEENDAIPPDFGKNKTVLICILKDRKSYDKYLKKAVEKNYKGEYLLIEASDLASYTDREKYRYVFDYSLGSTNVYSNGFSRSAKRFHIFDRLTNKTYESGAEFSFFAKAMKIYMSNLEKKRQSQQ